MPGNETHQGTWRSAAFSPDGKLRRIDSSEPVIGTAARTSLRRARCPAWD